MQSKDLYNELPDDALLDSTARYFDEIFHHPICPYTAEEILAEPLNNPRQHTIHMDTIRTRARLFADLPTHSKEFEPLLTHFCRTNKIEYKQGLNEILAPFMYLRKGGVSVTQCYALFSCFFTRYCFNFYFDKEFTSMEILFKMVSIVLKYHHPQLARYLQQHEIEAQIFCICWLMTIFSNKLSLSLTYSLWQLIVAEQDIFFIFFIVVAIIIYRREAIMCTKSESIFTIITDMIFKNQAELAQVVTIALLLRKTTPASLVLFFKKREIFKSGMNEQLRRLMENVEKLDLFMVLSSQISVKEHFRHGLCAQHECYLCALRKPLRIAQHTRLYQQQSPFLRTLLDLSCDIRSMEYNIEFIVIDLRAQQAQGSTLQKVCKQVHRVEVTQKIAVSEEEFLQKFMQSRGSEHFIFFMTRFSFEDETDVDQEELFVAKKLISSLNSYSFPYLSILEGGLDSYRFFETEIKMRSLISISSDVLCQVPVAPVPIKALLKIDYLMKVSEIVLLGQMYYAKTLEIYPGFQSSLHRMLLVTPNVVLVVEANPQLRRIYHLLKASTSLLGHIINSPELATLPLKVIKIVPVLRMKRISVEINKLNVIILRFMEGKARQVGEDMGLGELLRAGTKEFLKDKLEESESVYNKEIFDMGSVETVKELAKGLRDSYIGAIKKKRQLQKEGLHREEEFTEQAQKC